MNRPSTGAQARTWMTLLCLGAALGGCGGSDTADPAPAPAPAPAAPLACDDGIKAAFKPDANTTVTLVKAFKAGDAIALPGTPATPAPPVAPADVCLVKLLVGPGNPGPAGAPSTSAGIGIEVWLPAAGAWNRIIRVFGSGGWAGGPHADVAQVGSRAIFFAALKKGYAFSASDHGHAPLNNGSFAMNPDGSLNTVLWQDFAERSMHELADKTKALVKAYYASAQERAYWDGFSTGGRQGYKIAQKYPKDFDGILAGAPAFNWSRFITAELYPQVVMQRELGGPLAAAKLALVSGAAVKSCDALGLGFLLDPLQCRYDATRDASVLCSGVAGNGTTGASSSAACVSLKEARAINQIWYGQTADGSVPDPQADNGGSATLGSADHLWWGLTRGTSLALSLAGTNPFPIASDQVALELQDPRIAGSNFTNATGNGASGWKALDYAGLANAYAQGLALQPYFSNINTDSTDLSGVRDAGVKVLSYHGLADDKIMPQGSINYFTRVSAAMGGNGEVQKFNRLFLIPGLAHDSTFALAGSIDPATGALLNPGKVPLPQPVSGRDELFSALRDWVEKGIAPSRIEVSSGDGSVSMPLCVYPQKASYGGSGAVTAAASYTCK
ncbi:tannase/feruloyl esterase family alpha/beta hydrolase [Aquabacterium sp.]|uniref:tannase/feruloyl esterase family alpha/beta hydrolase n=1 Tax=Aquabacterium sp. TaxID=1872578 RepID=UPI003783C792